MDKIWEELYSEAKKVLNSHSVSKILVRLNLQMLFLGI